MVAPLNTTIPDIPPIISVDDHVIEPPDLWERWLPARFRDAGPKVVKASYELLGAQPPYIRRVASGPTADFWEYGSLSDGHRRGCRGCGSASRTGLP